MISSGVYPILPNRIGAIEPYVYGLAKNLATSGNYVDVLGLGTGNLLDGNLHIYGMQYVQNLQASLSKMLDWRVAYYGPYNAFILKNLLRLHMKNPIDILHIHEIYSGFAATISQFSLGIPYVCSIHNEIRTALPISSCNKVLAVSEYIEQHLINQRKINKENVSLLNVAIPIDDAVSAKQVLRAKEELGLEKYRIILFIGRKCPEKGPQVLIEALPKIKTDSKILAIFIGPDNYFDDPSTSFTDLLLKKAKLLRIDDMVLFTGFISDETKKKYLLAADIFVCPSVWQDPSPTVIKEALSYSKPVVATSVGGTSSIITNGFNGLLVPAGDANSLADALITLLNDPVYASKLGSNGRMTIAEKFSFMTVGKECLRIYNDVIG